MRKEKIVVIQDEGRDKGKAFLLTEMAASKAEKWAMRALLAVARSGVEIPVELVNGGMQALAIIGIRALTSLSFADAEPLLDEAMECVQFIPDHRNQPGVYRKLIEDDIEEVTTRIQLKREVIDLHLGFSITGNPSTQTSGTPVMASSNTSTSPAASAPLSRQARRR